MWDKLSTNALLLITLGGCLAAGSAQPSPVSEESSPDTAVISVPLLMTKSVTVASATTPPAINTEDRILPLEAVVNGAKNGVWLFMERNGILYAPYDAFEEWRVQLPSETKPIDFKLNDQAYFPLTAIPGYKHKLDFANQSVDLTFSPEVFLATQLTNEKSIKRVYSPVLPSMFLNYDWNYQTSTQNNLATINDLGILTEIGVSNSWGVLTSSQTGRNLTNDPSTGIKRGLIRLETTFTKDFPDQNRTLRLGDTGTRTGMWGRNVYFGGVQFGSNFALTPGFVTQPVPSLTGLSTAPSTVELYVNDVLRQTSNVPTGPFTIDNFPLLTGSGDVKMVVHDILGRETVIEQSFFITTQLLAAGLDDWSVEAGSLRRDIGSANNHYGPGFASGTWRHGYTNELTLEGRAEATSHLKTLGGGITAALPRQILGKASLAISAGQNQDGGLWLLGLENRRLHSNVSVQVQGASPYFHQLGQDVAVSPVKLQLAGNWSYSSERAGSFGIGLAILNRFDNSRISTVSGNYSTKVGLRNNINITASRAINGASGTYIGAYLVMPLDNYKVASATANIHDGQQDMYFSETYSPVNYGEVGWRTMAGRQQNEMRAEGGAYYTGRYGKLSSDASISPNQKALRLGANGGLVFADKNLFATQRLDQSYAVAEVADYQDIGVGIGGNILTRTNSNGAALIPRLIPYQNNAIRLDPSGLPLNAEIESIEQTAVPAWRSAVKVDFPIRSGRSALIKIILDDGDFAPAGAIVHIKGDKEDFYVARHGEAFVTGLQTDSTVELEWKNQKCTFEVKLPAESPDEITRLGPLNCKGVAR